MKEFLDFQPTIDDSDPSAAGSLMDEIRQTAEKVRQYPSYLRTQSSAARGLARRALEGSVSPASPEVEAANLHIQNLHGATGAAYRASHNFEGIDISKRS